MEDIKLKELRIIFKVLEEAREANLPTFPYSEVRASFNIKLKKYLKECFGSHIVFDKDETFAYIQAHYQGVPIEINTYGGIIFTVENYDDASVIEDFKEIFDAIVGENPICSYNTCHHDEDGNKVAYPTIEWNLGPDTRLLELVSYPLPDCYITDLEDYHNKSVIMSLGTNLFTVQGYKELFRDKLMNYKYKAHIIKQIQKQNPNLTEGMIYNWCISCDRVLELSQESEYQMCLVNDGK